MSLITNLKYANNYKAEHEKLGKGYKYIIYVPNTDKSDKNSKDYIDKDKSDIIILESVEEDKKFESVEEDKKFESVEDKNVEEDKKFESVEDKNVEEDKKFEEFVKRVIETDCCWGFYNFKYRKDDIDKQKIISFNWAKEATTPKIKMTFSSYTKQFLTDFKVPLSIQCTDYSNFDKEDIIKKL